MANEKRLIDANALRDRFKLRLDWLKLDVHDEYTKGLYHGCDYDMTLINELPTVDAVEVKHGEWTMVIDENDCECIECPLCGGQFYDGDNDTFDKPYNYCPNCGADMRW